MLKDTSREIQLHPILIVSVGLKAISVGCQNMMIWCHHLKRDVLNEVFDSCDTDVFHFSICCRN